MGKLKNIISTRLSGNVGAMNFRQRSGEVVVAERVYTNKSKGDGATESQRIHRSRLANIVNFYRVILELEKKAWANKQGGQSDFNMFAKYNLANSPIFLTKQEAALGAAVIAPYKVSMGALEPLACAYDGDIFKTGVALGAAFAFADATIGALADAIVSNNTDWKYGDKLSIAIFTGNTRTLTEAAIPVVNVKYLELTLNAGDSTLLADVPNFSALSAAKAADNSFVINNGASAGVAVHSREINSTLLASEQFIVVNASSYTLNRTYSSEAQKQKAMDSYGYKPDVLLTPYSEIDVQVIDPAYISSVTLAGNDLTDGATYAQGGQLVISGVGLSRSNVQVYNGSELYTPQSESGSQQTFYIAYPGNYRIIVNGNIAYQFTGTMPVPANVTLVKVGTHQSTTAPLVYNGFARGGRFDCVVEGTDLGTPSATGAEVDTVSGDATRRTFRLLLSSDTDVSGWTVSIGSTVVAQGSFS